MSIVHRIRALFSLPKVTDDIQDELSSHIEMRTEANIAAGMTPEEARRDALLRFGNPAAIKEQVVAEAAAMSILGITPHVKYAFRQLFRNRGFATTAILTLALGIGATTGIFSVLDAWILRPLPLKDPKQLVLLWRAAPSAPTEPAYFFSWRDYLYFRDRSRVFEELGASFARRYALTGRGEPQNLDGAVASQTLFSTLGVKPFRGRLFLPEDVNGPSVAVMSYALWTTQFHRSLDVLGETLTLNDKPFKVIGVLPASFSFRVLDQPNDAGVWTLIQTGDPDYAQNSAAAVAIVGRLKPGMTARQAGSEISFVQAENDQRYPDSPKSSTLVVGLQEDNTRTVRSSLVVLSGAVGLLLLIACINTASLIVGRNIRREREFAIRAALGSGIGRLLVQLLVENLVLYGVSGALGLLIAYSLIRGVTASNPFGILPSRPISLSLPAVSVAASLSLLSGVTFGLYPAFAAARVKVNQALQSSTHRTTAGATQLRSRSILVVTQIAVSVMLLLGASLLFTTFLRLNSQPLGFSVSDTHILNLSLPHTRYRSDNQVSRFSDRLLERLRTLPEVDAAGMTLFLRLADAGTTPFQINGTRESTEESLPRAVPVTVSPGYFQAMGIPLLQGRDFSFSENDGQSLHPVALLNQEAVKRYFRTTPPIGAHIKIGDPKNPETQRRPLVEIVGVVGSTKSVPYNQISWDVRPEFYIDYRQQQIHQNAQNWDYTSMSFVIHTRPGVGLSTSALHDAVRSEDPNLPVGEITSLGDMVARLQTQPRVRAGFLTLFACVTLLLAGIGIYGVMAQSVTQRHQEIGIRMALGADRRSVVLVVLRQGFGLTLAGLFFGVLFGVVAVRFMSSLLYGITANSPVTYVVVIAVVTFVAALATLLPARRAATIDPAGSLRSE